MSTDASLKLLIQHLKIIRVTDKAFRPLMMPAKNSEKALGQFRRQPIKRLIYTALELCVV